MGLKVALERRLKSVLNPKTVNLIALQASFSVVVGYTSQREALRKLLPCVGYSQVRYDDVTVSKVVHPH